jgi:hypothetical protein
MSDKPSWAKFDCLFPGEVPVSLINEPIDYTVDFTESATARAQRRWRCEPELINGDQRERE